MIELSIRDFGKEVSRLCMEGDYESATNLIEEYKNKFSEDIIDTAYGIIEASEGE